MPLGEGADRPQGYRCNLSTPDHRGDAHGATTQESGRCRIPRGIKPGETPVPLRL